MLAGCRSIKFYYGCVLMAVTLMLYSINPKPMKSLLKASVVLFLFAFSITLFQLSCTKDADAQAGNSSSVIVFNKFVNGQYQIWKADGNGNNQTYVPITLPPGYVFTFGYEGGTLRLSPDRSTIYFTASTPTYSESTTSIFSCTINGANVTRLIDGCKHHYDVKQVDLI